MSRHVSGRHHRPESSGSAVFHSSMKQPHSGVLLKTATIATVCIKETVAVDAAILFDEGSQEYFITQQQTDQLHLQVDGTEMLNIASFGGNTTRVRHVDRSTIYVKTDDNEIIPLSVLAVSTLAKPIDTSLMSAAATFPIPDE
ncbi:hypothetical protein DPMN_194828 [Dreissena polymorpha]|uniref:Uncharacterized protein n=1 Tax=Dreissena polymorpha TaxID=45954 RepID=A0A9D3Y5K8_DREPO|nr:hypothetical protein DPMN_194828 [Dreissena polymorpha]